MATTKEKEPMRTINVQFGELTWRFMCGGLVFTRDCNNDEDGVPRKHRPSRGAMHGVLIKAKDIDRLAKLLTLVKPVLEAKERWESFVDGSPSQTEAEAEMEFQYEDFIKKWNAYSKQERANKETV